MLHRLCGPPSIPLSFTLASILPRRCTYRLSYGTDACMAPTPSAHRLQRGLPGYLILFAPHAFASQRQYRSRRPLSPPVFLPISTNFTSTLGIPPPSPVLKPGSFRCTSPGGRGRVSVPVWLVTLWDQLTIVALVGRSPTKRLIVRGPISR